jgi:hypothetical protein
MFLKKHFDFNNPSLFFILLPYLSFYHKEFYNSYYFDWPLSILLIIVIFIFDIFISRLNRYRNNLIIILSIFVISLVIVFLYGNLFIYFLNGIQFFFLNQIIVRGRLVLPFLIVFVFFFEYFIRKKMQMGYYFQNIFLGIYSVFNIFLNYNGSQVRVDSNNFKSEKITIKSSSSENKPIILIITDEYASPHGLVNIFKDSSVFDFEKQLINDGWLVKSNFHTNSTSTIHSLSSLFNFNQSNDIRYNNINFKEIAAEKLLKSSLYDSLKYKNVDIINLGILDFGLTKPINRLYLYPINFFDVFLEYTIFPQIKRSTKNFSFNSITADFYPDEDHNKYILENLIDTVENSTKKKLFVYVHLKMPHGPFMFKDEFEHKDENLYNYYDFWKFTNYKIALLLGDLIREGRYRVILTGDHGYRGYRKISPNVTFSAFYGFESTEVQKVKNVQDLGSLINGYFY